MNSSDLPQNEILTTGEEINSSFHFHPTNRKKPQL